MCLKDNAGYKTTKQGHLGVFYVFYEIKEKITFPSIPRKKLIKKVSKKVIKDLKYNLCH